MEIIKALISIFAATFVGFNILFLLSSIFKRGEISFLERLSVSYGIGLGFTSLEMLFFHFFNVEFDLFRIFAPWMGLLAANLIIYYMKRRLPLTVAGPQTGPVKIRPLYILLVSGISFEILYSLFRALIKPIESYDAVAIYAIKSKIFYMAGAIPQDFFRNLALVFPHPDYPLNIPLSETLLFLALGGLNDQLVKLIFPLFFLGILVTIYFAIRRFANKTYSLLFTYLLATVPQFNAYSANAYLDLPLAYYCFTSAIFLFMWFGDRKSTLFLVLSALMAGLSAWTKNEGVMYCLINMALIVIYLLFEDRKITLKGIGHLAVYGSIMLLINMPWLWVKASSHLVNSDSGTIDIGPMNLLRQFCGKIAPIIYEFQKHILGPKKWNILWIVVIFVGILRYRKMFDGMQKYITLSLMLTVGGYVFVYLAYNVEISYFLRTTWSRFLVHFLPLVIYWLARMLKEDVEI